MLMRRGGKEGLNDFKFSTSIGRFSDDGAERMAAKGFKSGD